MKSHSKRILNNTISAILAILIMIVGFFSLVGITFNIVYTPASIKSYSMWPTLNEFVKDPYTVGDYAYMNNFAKPSNNDIVIAKVNWYGEEIIKRLVASPGDTLEIRDETTHYGLYVNENLVYTRDKTDVDVHGGEGGTNEYFESYKTLLQSTQVSTGTTSAGEKCILLKEDEYFLMGDNWSETLDCMKYGPVSLTNICGKVDFIIKMGENKFFEMIKQILITTFKIK